MFECKLFDLYLGKINSHDVSTQTVIIPKDEFEKAMGTTRLHSDLLDQRLQKMIRRIDIDDGGQYPRHVALFQQAYLNMNTSPYQIELECSNKILDLIFNIEKIGYFKYKLRNILRIESLYSYLLFNYLEYNRQKRKQSVWEVDLDELKEILNCSSPVYDTFKRFNDLILKKCHTELNQKTELKYSYSTIKRGRKVVAIKFDLKPLDIEAIEENEHEVLIQHKAATASNTILNSDIETILDLYPQYTDKDVTAIYNRIIRLQPDKGQYGTARIDYFKSVYDDAARQEQKNGTKINDYTAYIIKMLDKRLHQGGEP